MGKIKLVRQKSKRSLLSNIRTLVFITTFLFLLSGCGSGGDLNQKTDAALTDPPALNDDEDYINNVDEGPTSEIRLVVKDINGAPVPNARLSFHKKETSQLLRIEETDSNGEYIFSDVPISHLYAIEIDHKDYAVHVVSTKDFLRLNEDNAYAATLLPMSPVVMVSQVEEGTTIEPPDSDGTKITIPPNAFVNANGEPVTGSVEIRVRNLDVSNDEEMAAYPGELRAMSNNELVQLFTYGVFFIDIMQNNTLLELAEGKTIRVEIPVLSPLHSNGNPVKVGDSIPLWYLDLDTGIWQHDNVVEVIEAPNTPLKLAGVVELTHLLEPVTVTAEVDADAEAGEKTGKKLPFLNGQARAVNCATATKAQILAAYGGNINKVPSSCLCAKPALFGITAADCASGGATSDRELHTGRRGAFNLDAELPQHKITVRFRTPNEAIEANNELLVPEKMCLGIRVVWGYFKDRDQSKYPGEKEAECHDKTTRPGSEVFTGGHGIMCHGWGLNVDFTKAFVPSTDAPYAVPHPDTSLSTAKPYEIRKNLCYLYTLFDSLHDDSSESWDPQLAKSNYSCYCLDDNKDIINQRFWMEWEFTWDWINDKGPGWTLYTDGSKTKRNSRYNNGGTDSSGTVLDKWWDDDKNGIPGEATDSDGIPYNKDTECFSVTPPLVCIRASDRTSPMSENPSVRYLANEKPTVGIVPESEIVADFASVAAQNTGADSKLGDLKPYNVTSPTAAQANNETNYIVGTATSGRLSRERYQNAYSENLSSSCIKHANDGTANANQYGKLSGSAFSRQNCNTSEIFAPRTKGPARKNGSSYVIEEGETGQITFVAKDKEYIPNLRPILALSGGTISALQSGMVRAPHFTFSSVPERPLYFGNLVVGGVTQVGKGLIWNLDTTNSPDYVQPKLFVTRIDTPFTTPLSPIQEIYLNEVSSYIGIPKEVWYTYTVSGSGTITFSVEDYSINTAVDIDGYSTNTQFNVNGLPDTSGARRKTSDTVSATFVANGKPVMRDGLTVYVNKATAGQSYNLNAPISQPGLSCTLASGSCSYPYATLAASTSTDDSVRSLSTDTDARSSDPHTYTIVSGANFSGGSTITYTYPANSTSTAKVTAYVKDSRGRPSLNSDGSIQTGTITVLVNTPPTACNVTAPEQQKNVEGSFTIGSRSCTDSGTKTDSDSRPSTLKYYLVANTAGNFVSNLAEDGTVTYRPTVGTTAGDTRTFTYRTFDGAAYSDAKTVTIVTKNTAPVASSAAGTSSGNRISIPYNVSPSAYSIDLRALISDPNSGFATETYTYALQSSSGHIGGAVSISGYTATFLPTTIGTGQFTITVTDGSTASQNITVYYNVYNSAPNGFAVNSCSAHDTTGCTISWNIPADSNGHSVSMRVDGVSVGGATSRKVSPGNHTVEACDTLNACTAVTGTASFTNSAPATPTISASNTSPLIGAAVTITCSGGSDPEGDTVTVECNGSPSVTRSTAGAQTFSARSCDSHGACSAYAQVTVTWR